MCRPGDVPLDFSVTNVTKCFKFINIWVNINQNFGIMSAVRIFAMLAATLLGAALINAEPVSRQTLAIVLEAQAEYSERLLDSMEKELVEILNTPDLDVEFRHYSEAANEGFDRVIVVRLIGDCVAMPAYGVPPLGEALGSTHVSDGVVLPFIDIHCDRVRALLTNAMPRLFTAGDTQLVGRALGRVLAHEVYHVLSGSLHHDHNGVAMASLSASDLTCEHLDLSDTCLGVIRRAFALAPDNIAD